MKKPKTREKHVYFFPLALLLAADFLFYAFSFFIGYSDIMDQFSVLCRYFAFLYLCVIITEALLRTLRKNGAKQTQSTAEKPEKPKASLLRKLPFKKKKPEAEPETKPEQAPPADVPAGEKPEAPAGKDRLSQRMRLLTAAHVVVQAFFLYRLIRYEAQRIGVKAVSFNDYYALFSIGTAITFTVLFFAAAMWMKGKDVLPGSNTGRMLLLLTGGTFAAGALFMTLYVMLNIPALGVLMFLLRLFGILVSALIALGIAISLIKQDLMERFDYFSILAPVGKGEKRSIADFLEENTGLSVKSLWSIRYALSILPAAALGLALVLFLSTSLYKVEAHQQAIVYRLGKISESGVVGAGLHIKLPWPIDKAEIYDVKRVREMMIGYDEQISVDNLWTQQHSGEEYKLLLGNGNELVSVNMKVSFVIEDLAKYVTAFSKPEEILQAKAYELILNKTVNTDLDTFLSVDRSSLSEEMAKDLNRFCEEAGFGLHVNQVVLESIHPPIEIADVYQSVVSAAVQKNTLVTNAEANALEKLLNAEKESNTLIIAAQQDQTTRLSEAKSEMDVFLATAEAYRSHPDAVTLQKYLDTFRTVVVGRKVYVFIGRHDADDYLLNFSNNQTTVIDNSLLSTRP